MLEEKGGDLGIYDHVLMELMRKGRTESLRKKRGISKLRYKGKKEKYQGRKITTPCSEVEPSVLERIW
jgi:hypothetical protein